MHGLGGIADGKPGLGLVMRGQHGGVLAVLALTVGQCAQAKAGVLAVQNMIHHAGAGGQKLAGGRVIQFNRQLTPWLFARDLKHKGEIHHIKAGGKGLAHLCFNGSKIFVAVADLYRKTLSGKRAHRAEIHQCACCKAGKRQTKANKNAAISL